MKKLLFIILIIYSSLSAQNLMMVADTSGSAGDTVAVRILITNDSSFVAFQTDIQLPAETGYIANSAVLSSRSNGHMVSASLLNGNILRVIAFSLNQSSFTGSSGEVARFKVKLGKKPGVYPVTLINPIISNKQSQNIITGSADGSITIFAPDININMLEVDFGKVPWYTSPESSFQIANNGTLPLLVSRIFSSSAFFKIMSDTSVIIQPGGSALVTVAFRSYVSGIYEETITVLSDDPDQPAVRVVLKGISYSVNELYVGEASGRSGYDVELPVSLNMMEPVSGLQFDLLIPPALQYNGGGAVLSSRKKDHVVSVSRIADGRVRVVAFSPTNQVFSDSSGEVMKIRFQLDGSGGTYGIYPDSVFITSPQAVNIASASYPGSVTIISPDISAVQNAVIGETPVTDTLRVSYQIDNPGSDTLLISSITSSSALFVASSVYPFIIPPGSNGSFTLRFYSPVKGTFSGRLYIRSNDPDEDPFFIDVTASAFAPNYLKLASLTARVGDTVTVSLQIDNYEEFVAFQTDITLPPEFQYIPGSAVLTGRKADHTLSAGIVNQTTLRLFAFSLTQAKFTGSSGAVAELKYLVGNIPGQSEMILSSSVLSNPQSQNILKSSINGNINVYPVPGVPVLISPANGSVSVPLTPQFFWSISAGSDQYRIQIAGDSLFSSVIADQWVSDTEYTFSGLNFLTKYYWRVRGVNQGGNGAWSQTSYFITIIEKPSTVTLSSPANNSKGLLNPVSVSWNPSARAEKYILQVSTSSTFDTFVVNDSNQTDLSEILPTLNNYTEYFWRVKSVNAGGQSDWSEVWNFKTLGNSYPSTLYAPANNSVNQPVTGLVFKWSRAQERIETIQKYQFQLATDDQFTTIVANDSTLTDTIKTLNSLSYLTKYYWRVRAQNQTGWGDWSDVWNTTTIIEKPANFTLSAPANNSKALLNPVTVSWNSSARAEKYILQVSASSTFNTFVVNDSTQTDLTEVLPTLNNYTEYFWRVKSVNIGGQSDWSEVWNFKTRGNPYASTLYIPANNSVNQPIIGLVFKWSRAQERIETIQKYQYQLATDTLFLNIVQNDSTLTDTTKTVDDLNYSAFYYWRVRAQNETGWGDWSAVWHFSTIIKKPENFTLISPANNSTGLLNPVTVSWSFSPRTEKFILQVSTSSDFSSFVVNDSLQSGLNQELPPLNNHTLYYWRMRAINFGGTSDWTEVWNFKTLGNPYASTLYTPANNSVNQPVTGLVFKWSKAQERIETIQKYQFQLATDAQFTTIIQNDTTLTDTTKTVNSLSYLTQYYWRVRAQNQTGWGDWSEVWNTTTIIAAPVQVTLSRPGNNAVNQALNTSLNWNALTGAETYELQVSNDATFTSIVRDTTFGGTSKQMWGLLNSTKYYWRVRASNVGGTGSWSEVWNFTTIIAAPGQVVLSGPANNAINQALHVSLSWIQLSGAETYQLQVSNDANFTTVVKDTTFNGTSKQMWGLSNLTKYYWRVRASNIGGTGNWSEVWNFTTIIAAPGQITLSSPANNAVNQALNTSLTWNALTGAETYQLQVSTDANFTIVIKDTTFSGTSKQMWGLLNSTKYYWRVRASNIGGTGNWSEVWNFTTIIAAPGQVDLSSPANNAVNQALNTSLTWNALIGAETYQLQVSTDANFTSIVRDTTFGGTSKQIWGLLNSMKYYWRVRASNIGGTGNWSGVWNFTTIIANPTSVLLQTPANNSSNVALNTSLTWSALSGAETYQLQVSSDANFTTVVKDTTFGGTSKQMWGLSNSTKYYWRVRASNVGGTGSWSEVWNFTTIIAAPGQVVLSGPANNSINQALHVSLSWIQLSGAETYQLQVSTDANFTTVLKDTTFGGNSKQIWGLLNSTKYYWRVRASNVGGTGNWSEVWNFTTIIEKPANVTLSAPANNSKGLLNPVTVSWKSSARAEKYILQVSTSSTFNTFVVNDSAQTDLSEVLPELNNYTEYFWRVKSVNIGGQSDWSEVWNFKTLGNPYASTLYIPANNSVNQPVTGLVFKWSRAQERIETIQKYQYQLATDTLFLNIVQNDSTLTDTTKTVDDLNYSAFYYWRVRAQNETGWGDWSEVWNTTTIIEKPANFTLSAPANNSMGLLNPVTVSWKSSARAEKYILQVSTSSTFNTFVINDSAQTDLSEVLPELNNYTEYFWRVKSVNIGGQSDWSEVWNFKTLGIPYASILYVPANNSVNQPITGLIFKWSKAQERIETIQQYQFQLATDSSFSAIVNNDSTLTDTSTTVNNLSYLTKYYWRVRAQNQTAWGDWSEVWNTTTIIELPGTPVLIYPENNAQNITVDPVFVWNTAPRSVKYLFQISDTADFSTIAIQDSAITDTSKSITGLQQGKVYFWRVKALNTAGWGNFATAARFTTLLTAPTQLIAAVVDLRNIQLNWIDNSTNETGYMVERKTGDTASANAYAVIADNLPTNTTSFTDTAAVYADPSLRFSYRVRSANAVAQSQYSNQSSAQFTIPAPLLVSPADNVSELRDSVQLIWRSLLGSIAAMQPGQLFEYHLQVALDSLFANLLVNDSTMTDTIKTVTLADGNRYYWRVRAKMTAYGEFSPFRRYTSAINAPDSLTAVYDPEQRKVILNWLDRSSSEAGFIIERKDSTGNYVFVANALADAQSYEDAQMNLWSTFIYRIQSSNEYDSSEYSESQSVFTDIRDLAQIPEEYQLSQNYPNPFNPSTVIRFGVPHSSLVYVLLYNIQGQQVLELYRGEVSPGFYELKSDLSQLSSGIYFYRIVARSSEGEVFTETRKLSLIK